MKCTFAPTTIGTDIDPTGQWRIAILKPDASLDAGKRYVMARNGKNPAAEPILFCAKHALDERNTMKALVGHLRELSLAPVKSGQFCMLCGPKYLKGGETGKKETPFVLSSESEGEEPQSKEQLENEIFTLSKDVENLEKTLMESATARALEINISNLESVNRKFTQKVDLYRNFDDKNFNYDGLKTYIKEVDNMIDFYKNELSKIKRGQETPLQLPPQPKAQAKEKKPRKKKEEIVPKPTPKPNEEIEKLLGLIDTFDKEADGAISSFVLRIIINNLEKRLSELKEKYDPETISDVDLKRRVRSHLDTIPGHIIAYKEKLEEMVQQETPLPPQIIEPLPQIVKPREKKSQKPENLETRKFNELKELKDAIDFPIVEVKKEKEKAAEKGEEFKYTSALSADINLARDSLPNFNANYNHFFGLYGNGIYKDEMQPLKDWFEGAKKELAGIIKDRESAKKKKSVKYSELKREKKRKEKEHEMELELELEKRREFEERILEAFKDEYNFDEFRDEFIKRIKQEEEEQ